MKVLLVTGRLAQAQVRAFAGEADVLVANVDVASFITPQMLLGRAPQGYDLILIPGAITADFREAERALGAKIRLGPKHAADLGIVLHHLAKEKIELSRTVPACQLLEGKMRENALDQVERLEARAGAPQQIRGVKIGGSSRMKVLAEIVDATRCSPAALTERIRYYEEQGADMIDLGIPLDANPAEVKAALQTARKATNLPLSIDTIKPELILAGLEAGADLLLSLNGSNLPLVGEAVARAGVPAVIIPGPGSVRLEENLAYGSGDGNIHYSRSCSRTASAGTGPFAAKVPALPAGSSRHPSLFWSGKCNGADRRRYRRRQCPFSRSWRRDWRIYPFHTGVQRQSGRERARTCSGFENDAAGPRAPCASQGPGP